jgi:phage shock protein C
MEAKNMENKKLYRSSTNYKLAGVCGGIGEYFNIDPTLVRLGWIAFSVLGGAGLLAYIIAAIVMPK